VCCDLMHVNGMRADCAKNSCVYWARLGQDADQQMQCALDYFGLVGPASDKLSRWLLEFKLKNRTELSIADYAGLIDP